MFVAVRVARSAIKAGVDAIALVCIAPLLMSYGLAVLLWPSRRDLFFQDAGHGLSLIPGLPGVFCRRAFYRRTMKLCSDSVWIGFGSLLTKPGTVLGDNVYIGVNCMVGLATIGSGTLLGSNVDIPSGKSQHGFQQADTPIRLQPGSFNRINIGADVWLGNGCIVLADVGDHAIVAAGGVVVDPVAEWSIVGGNPARSIGDRRKRGDSTD